LSPNVRERLGILGEQIALAVANLRLRETLRNQSIRDPLTTLFNRRYAEETLHRELMRCERANANLSIALLDVDHFKKFNDTYGHETGDEVLKEIARFLQFQTRGGDVASRLGGEELMVILPGANAEDAVKKAETLRGGIRELKVRSQGKTIGPVTVSIGVASFGAHGRTGEELLRSADAALYRAKREGRDRVMVAS
jgi:diguanylate cyclase (GGDEF)-like protein